MEDNLADLRAALLEQTYAPGGYRSFYIHEPKRRLISAAPFRDRVVHHALVNVIEPVFERSFIFDSYANRVGKGTHRALDRCQRFMRLHRYALQCDIRHFFPSIDHAILREELARKVTDPRTLRLIEAILAGGAGISSEGSPIDWFAGDDLFAALRPRGLPIGNLTSQFWANCHMSPFDHFVKREMRCAAYLRYVDDFILFGDDKTQLEDWHARVVERCGRLRQTLHESGQPRPVTEGLTFLGFRVFPQRRRLKRSKAFHFARRFKALLAEWREGGLSFDQLTATARGWANHVRYANTVGLRTRMFQAGAAQSGHPSR